MTRLDITDKPRVIAVFRLDYPNCIRNLTMFSADELRGKKPMIYSNWTLNKKLSSFVSFGDIWLNLFDRVKKCDRRVATYLSKSS